MKLKLSSMNNGEKIFTFGDKTQKDLLSNVAYLHKRL